MYLIAAISAVSIGSLRLRSGCAQGQDGSLSGNITDLTAASIPEAKVKTNRGQTNMVREALTFTQRNIPVTINSTVHTGIVLPVGRPRGRWK